MRNLLMELQESGFLKEPQITASSISFGGSGVTWDSVKEPEISLLSLYRSCYQMMFV